MNSHQRKVKRLKLWNQQKGRCFYCRCKVTQGADDATIDHKTPQALGGSDYDNNLVLACVLCNAEKRNTPFDDYMIIVNQRRDELSAERSKQNDSATTGGKG